MNEEPIVIEESEDEEEWENAKYFCGRTFEMLDLEKYEASTLGELRNRITKRIVTKRLNADGYYCCTIDVQGVRTMKLLHRIIGSTFHGRPKVNSLTIDHVNRCRTDNRLSNLEWTSSSGQALNSKTHIKRGMKIPICQKRDGVVVATYDSACDVPDVIDSRISEAILKRRVFLGCTWEVLPIDNRDDEIWKKWGDDDSEYSDQGRIRRTHQTEVQYEVIPGVKGGYSFVYGKKLGKGVRLHRILAFLFFGFDINDNTIAIRHINGDRLDNRISNLEIIERKRGPLLSCGKIFEVRNKITGELKLCEGVKEVSSWTGIDPTHVSAAANGRLKYKKWEISVVETVREKRMRESLKNS